MNENEIIAKLQQENLTMKNDMDTLKVKLELTLGQLQLATEKEKFKEEQEAKKKKDEEEAKKKAAEEEAKKKAAEEEAKKTAVQDKEKEIKDGITKLKTLIGEFDTKTTEYKEEEDKMRKQIAQKYLWSNKLKKKLAEKEKNNLADIKQKKEDISKGFENINKLKTELKEKLDAANLKSEIPQKTKPIDDEVQKMQKSMEGIGTSLSIIETPRSSAMLNIAMPLIGIAAAIYLGPYILSLAISSGYIASSWIFIVALLLAIYALKKLGTMMKNGIISLLSSLLWLDIWQIFGSAYVLSFLLANTIISPSLVVIALGALLIGAIFNIILKTEYFRNIRLSHIERIEVIKNEAGKDKKELVEQLAEMRVVCKQRAKSMEEKITSRMETMREKGECNGIPTTVYKTSLGLTAIQIVVNLVIADIGNIAISQLLSQQIVSALVSFASSGPIFLTLAAVGTGFFIYDFFHGQDARIREKLSNEIKNVEECRKRADDGEKELFKLKNISEINDYDKKNTEIRTWAERVEKMLTEEAKSCPPMLGK